jgi:hypothetical protein
VSATSPEQALRAAAGHGPFFALDPTPDARFAPLDDAALRGRVVATRAALVARFGHPVEERVAASLTHLDLAARLLSPALVTAATIGWVPDLSSVVWRDPPFQLGLAQLAEGTLASALERVERIGEVVAPRLPVRLRRGNVASVVATAGRLVPACGPLAAAILAAMPDAGTAQPQGFRRSSCCLYYRLDARAGLCGDCVLSGSGVR